ncbi:MAG TPA: hypothetical protein PKE42_03420 [Arachnia sp.]|jgi:predicted transcriptional regulator|nr:hypothetical protein [Arachnia sp.]
MTVTTIKVPMELRDRLKSAAAEERHTLAEHLESLLREDERRKRFARLRQQIALTPPDETYLVEADEWQRDQW